VVEGGRDAITHYRVVERFRAHTLLSCQLETGRTHQIRVHLNHIRHGIVGDPLYGPGLKLPKGASAGADRVPARVQAPGPACGRARVRTSAHEEAGRVQRGDARGHGRADRLPAARVAARIGLMDVVRPRAMAGARLRAGLHHDTPRSWGFVAAPFDASIWATMSATFRPRSARIATALRGALQLPGEPLWLRQVHGVQVVDADTLAAGSFPRPMPRSRAQSDCVLAILTADCLPVLFAARRWFGDRRRARRLARAGRRSCWKRRSPRCGSMPRRLVAWIGPGIRQPAFEVGPEVRDAFVAADRLAFAAFKPSPRPAHFLCDLAMLARLRLMQLGLTAIADCGLCTHADGGRFHSHRRDQRTGRMATVLWSEVDNRQTS
jgi:copper oxidase (laccase) domain-containing protein